MRYDKLVLMVKKGDEHVYNPDLGEYEESEPIITKYYCNISDMGNQLKAQMFGNISEDMKILRFQGKIMDWSEYDHIMLSSKKYAVELQRILKNKTTLYIKEKRT